MRIMTQRLWGLVAVFIAIVVAGCGGGGGGTPEGAGRATIKITWPDRSRLIPVASNSIKVTFTKSGVEVASKVLPRPATGNETTADFDALPPGVLTITAAAYPTTDGTGVAQAQASMLVTIEAGQVTPVDITMASTIDHLDVTPSPASVQTGSNVQLNVAAKNAANAVVLISPSKTTYESSAANIATVSNTGLVTGVAPGSAQITVTELESGKSRTVTVNVTGSSTNPPAEIYITDQNNNRIVRITDMIGGGWASLGKAGNASGNGVGEFWGPAGIFVDSTNRIYVTDYWNSQLVRMDSISGSNWVRLGSFGQNQGQFIYPTSVQVDSQNRIYVGHQKFYLIRMNDMTGAGWTTFGQSGTGVGGFTEAYGVHLGHDNRIYVADRTGARLTRFDDMNGTNWAAFGGIGTGVGQFSFPSDVATDSQGRIYVVDTNNNRIIRMNDITGSGWVSLGTQGSGINQFRLPTNVAISGDGKIYVVDSLNNRIVRVNDMTGVGWTTYGSAGGGVHQFNRPFGIFLK
jgi:sugar lactone lactonase YvrE